MRCSWKSITSYVIATNQSRIQNKKDKNYNGMIIESVLENNMYECMSRLTNLKKNEKLSFPNTKPNEPDVAFECLLT